MNNQVKEESEPTLVERSNNEFRGRRLRCAVVEDVESVENGLFEAGLPLFLWPELLTNEI